MCKVIAGRNVGMLERWSVVLSLGAILWLSLDTMLGAQMDTILGCCIAGCNSRVIAASVAWSVAESNAWPFCWNVMSIGPLLGASLDPIAGSHDKHV